MDYVAGYALCLDMTARGTCKTSARRRGLPWTLAKSFTASAPVSAFVPKEKIRDLTTWEALAQGQRRTQAGG